jgi:hypothetical protein
MSNFSFENVTNTLKCLDEKVLIQLESIIKFNCFLNMVYTKRPPKSYRKNICENHWFRAYGMFRADEGMEGRKLKINK